MKDPETSMETTEARRNMLPDHIQAEIEDKFADLDTKSKMVDIDNKCFCFVFINDG